MEAQDRERHEDEGGRNRMVDGCSVDAHAIRERLP